MIRLLTTIAAAALTLTACTPTAAAPAAEDVVAETPAAVPPSAPDGFQLSYKLESENYAVESEIDPAILAFDPALAWRLWETSKQQLDDLGASADEGRAMADEDAAAAGETSWFMNYSLEIRHDVTGTFDDIISVRDTVSTFTGGAHPNYFLAGGIYRKNEATPLPLTTFVTDQAAFNDLVIKGLAAEKIARGLAEAGSAAIEAELRELLVPSPEDPEIYRSNFVFEASTVPGKIGGITVMFSPYDVGSYAEGAYTVTLPAASLTPILTETWKSRFGGEPLVEDDEAPVE